jgi:hypothetical protein
MRIELEVDETREALAFLVDRMLKEAGLGEKDAAAVRKWRASLKSGSEAMREITSQVNADLARLLESQKRSSIIKPDWQ